MVRQTAAAAEVQASAASLMIKPVGAQCNLGCAYCYYLPTEAVFDRPQRRMDVAVLESVYAGYLPHAAAQTTISWQGGEPTLAGLPFFRQAMRFCERYRGSGQQVAHCLQTNGTLLNDAWCGFLAEHHFLVGLSCDGDQLRHDQHRRTRSGAPSYHLVQRGLELLQRHGVEYNVLCVLNRDNVTDPEGVLRALLRMGTRYVQFIPAIEWIEEDGVPPRLHPLSPDAKAYGEFLCRIFDLWFARYREHISIRIIDSTMHSMVNGQASICIMAPSCHGQITVEHDGSLFGCDHFVEEPWRMGAITPAADGGVDGEWLERFDSVRLARFSQRKLALPQDCHDCRYRRLCYGGCPKHRPQRGAVPAPTVLCEAYQSFFAHALPRLEWMLGFLTRGMPVPSAEAWSGGMPRSDRRVGRNDPCPCGSGRKYKRCCD